MERERDKGTRVDADALWEANWGSFCDVRDVDDQAGGSGQGSLTNTETRPGQRRRLPRKAAAIRTGWPDRW
jgi:hypothetical protein